MPTARPQYHVQVHERPMYPLLPTSGYCIVLSMVGPKNVSDTIGWLWEAWLLPPLAV